MMFEADDFGFPFHITDLSSTLQLMDVKIFEDPFTKITSNHVE